MTSEDVVRKAKEETFEFARVISGWLGLGVMKTWNGFSITGNKGEEYQLVGFKNAIEALPSYNGHPAKAGPMLSDGHCPVLCFSWCEGKTDPTEDVG